MSQTTALMDHNEVVAIKRTLSEGLRKRLRQRNRTVASLARELGTSRTAIQRVLDPQNASITLHTMVKAANCLGYRLELKLEPRIDRIERVATPSGVEPLMEKLGHVLDRLPS